MVSTRSRATSSAGAAKSVDSAGHAIEDGSMPEVMSRRSSGRTASGQTGKEEPMTPRSRARTTRAAAAAAATPVAAAPDLEPIPEATPAEEAAAAPAETGQVAQQQQQAPAGTPAQHATRHSTRHAASAAHSGSAEGAAATPHAADRQKQQQHEQEQQQPTTAARATRSRGAAADATTTTPAAAPAQPAPPARTPATTARRGGRAAKTPAAAAAAPAPAWAETGDFDLSGSGDDEEGFDFTGPGTLDALAASIRSALAARAPGGSEKEPLQLKKQQQQQPTAAGNAAAAAGAIAEPRWRPDTGLPMPAGSASLRDLTTTGRGAELAAAAAAAAAAAVAPPVPKVVEVATKEAGLAKQAVAAPRDPIRAAKEERKKAPDTAGRKWYNLPATEITDDVKRDLRLLHLRGAYDPKRFYKSFDESKFPKYFQFGTVVDDPLDGPDGRLTKAQRKATLTQQLLADTELGASRKRRFGKLQAEAEARVTKGKKRKTDNPRKQPPKHRPKH